jgi:hypothetical protein
MEADEACRFGIHNSFCLLVYYLKIGFGVMLLTIMFRCLPFTGVTPPATLSVGHGFENTTKWISLPTIDWKSPHIADILAYTSFPSSYSLQLASRAALDMAVLRISPPAPTNVSFHQQFHGPTVRCALANESQQPAFDAYTDFLWDDSVRTTSLFPFQSYCSDSPFTGFVPST